MSFKGEGCLDYSNLTCKACKSSYAHEHDLFEHSFSLTHQMQLKQGKTKSFSCPLCHTASGCEQNYMAHLEGKKHQQRLRQFKLFQKVTARQASKEKSGKSLSNKNNSAEVKAKKLKRVPKSKTSGENKSKNPDGDVPLGNDAPGETVKPNRFPEPIQESYTPLSMGEGSMENAYWHSNSSYYDRRSYNENSQQYPHPHRYNSNRQRYPPYNRKGYCSDVHSKFQSRYYHGPSQYYSRDYHRSASYQPRNNWHFNFCLEPHPSGDFTKDSSWQRNVQGHIFPENSENYLPKQEEMLHSNKLAKNNSLEDDTSEVKPDVTKTVSALHEDPSSKNEHHSYFLSSDSDGEGSKASKLKHSKTTQHAEFFPSSTSHQTDQYNMKKILDKLLYACKSKRLRPKLNQWLEDYEEQRKTEALPKLNLNLQCYDIESPELKFVSEVELSQLPQEMLLTLKSVLDIPEVGELNIPEQGGADECVSLPSNESNSDSVKTSESSVASKLNTLKLRKSSPENVSPHLSYDMLLTSPQHAKSPSRLTSKNSSSQNQPKSPLKRLSAELKQSNIAECSQQKQSEIAACSPKVQVKQEIDQADEDILEVPTNIDISHIKQENLESEVEPNDNHKAEVESHCSPESVINVEEDELSSFQLQNASVSQHSKNAQTSFVPTEVKSSILSPPADQIPSQSQTPQEARQLIENLMLVSQQEDATQNEGSLVDQNIATLTEALMNWKAKKEQLLQTSSQLRQRRLDLLEALKGILSVSFNSTSEQTRGFDETQGFPNSSDLTYLGSLDTTLEIMKHIMPQIKEMTSLGSSDVKVKIHDITDKVSPDTPPKGSVKRKKNTPSTKCASKAKKHCSPSSSKILETQETEDSEENTIQDASLLEGEISAHKGAIICVKIHQNFLYTTSTDNTAKRFDLKDHRNVITYLEHTGTVSTVQITLSGLVVTGCHDGFLRGFNQENGLCTRSVNVHSSIICSCLAWNRLYIGLSSGNIGVVNTKNLKILETFLCSKSSISQLTASKEGAQKLLCAVAFDGLITVRDATNGLLVRCMDGKVMPPSSLKISNGIVFTTSLEKKLLVHELRNGKLKREIEYESSPTGIFLSRTHLMCSFYNGLIRCYKLKDMSLSTMYYGAGKGKLMCMDVNKNVLCTANKNGQVEVFFLKKRPDCICQSAGCNLKFGRQEDLQHHLITVHEVPNREIKKTF